MRLPNSLSLSLYALSCIFSEKIRFFTRKSAFIRLLFTQFSLEAVAREFSLEPEYTTVTVRN